MKIKLQIKSVFGKVLFEFEQENNTIKDTLEEAIKSYADLRSADLSSADLRSVNLRSADLRYADLRSADLRSADLRSADLSSANLRSADLRYADLRYADLRSANLRSADLRSANLSSADLRSADMSYANANDSTAMFFSQCPTEGSFIAWKKAQGKIVKLEVTDSAKRSSATTLKCRCSQAKVLDIQETDGGSSGLDKIASNHDSSFIYKVGEIVEVPDFDDNRWNECSKGIHFFIDRDMAVRYN